MILRDVYPYIKQVAANVGGYLFSIATVTKLKCSLCSSMLVFLFYTGQLHRKRRDHMRDVTGAAADEIMKKHTL
jgi:hypothetical protein